MLQEVSGDNEYLFNPTGWILDKAGTQCNATRIVFHKAAIWRVTSCEFHYKQSANRKSLKLNGNRKSRFEAGVSPCSSGGHHRVGLRKAVSRPQPLYQRKVRWKTHIFGAFESGFQTPRMNMAGTVNLTWANVGPNN